MRGTYDGLYSAVVKQKITCYYYLPTRIHSDLFRNMQLIQLKYSSALCLFLCYKLQICKLSFSSCVTTIKNRLYKKSKG